MDRMIFTALNGLGNLRDAQSVSAQNLSNQNVPGFRRDLVNAGPTKFLTELNSLTGRAFQTDTESHRFSNAAGFMDQTGEMMDVAIEDDGYFDGACTLKLNSPPELALKLDLKQIIVNTGTKEVVYTLSAQKSMEFKKNLQNIVNAK